MRIAAAVGMRKKAPSPQAGAQVAQGLARCERAHLAWVPPLLICCLPSYFVATQIKPKDDSIAAIISTVMTAMLRHGDNFTRWQPLEIAASYQNGHG